MNLKISFTQAPNFRYLEKSENVRKLQEILSELGYDLGKGGVDMIFGNDTKKALDEFIKIGKIKTAGIFGEATKSALIQTENTLGNYVSLSWEKSDSKRSEWSKFVFESVEGLFDSSFSKCEDMEIFRSNYTSLNKEQKINVWGELISAICYYESGWNPTSRMVETTMDIDPITGNQVASEGLLQLSYQDKISYTGKVEKSCKFNWNIDKPLFLNNPKDPNITILDPYNNLEFGIGILAYQIKNYKKIILTKNVYWAVIKQGGKYEKINKIINFVENLKL
jgi:Putative peptidoglycan binding domain